MDNIEIDTLNIVRDCRISANYMKELTMLGVSIVTFLKRVFELEDNFERRYVGGVEVLMLKHECVDPRAQALSDYVRMSFDAIDKQYLQQLALCIYKDGTSLDNLFGYYLFQYNYANEQISLGNADNARNYTFSDIQNITTKYDQFFCEITEESPPLPDDYIMNIRLYFNSDTPEGYKVPFIGPFTEPTGDLEADVTSVSDGHWAWMLQGPVTTPFHQLAAFSFTRNQTTNDSGELALETPHIILKDDLKKAIKKYFYSPISE